MASSLSFFLWGSSPDEQLLDLAERGELSNPEVLRRTVQRMLADPKIERFLDTFPSQWMQLENALAATPDPSQQRYFSLDKNYPASLQMVVEPLLLFDAVFIEDRPVVELIDPSFSFQSEFLRSWYTSDLRPPQIDEAQVAEENLFRADRVKALEAAVAGQRSEIEDWDHGLPERIGRRLLEVDISAGQTAWEETQAKLLAASAVFSRGSA